MIEVSGIDRPSGPWMPLSPSTVEDPLPNRDAQTTSRTTAPSPHATSPIRLTVAETGMIGVSTNACQAYVSSAPPASANRCASRHPAADDHRSTSAVTAAKSTTRTATAAQADGTHLADMNTAPAARLVRPTIQVGGAERFGAGATAGRRNASTTSTTITTAETANWATDATYGSLARPNAVVAAMPTAKSRAVTVSPTRPSHGVVRRPRASPSTRAIGTLMLNTVCRARTNSVHGAPMPSAGRYPGSSSRCPA